MTRIQLLTKRLLNWYLPPSNRPNLTGLASSRLPYRLSANSPGSIIYPIHLSTGTSRRFRLAVTSALAWVKAAGRAHLQRLKTLLLAPLLYGSMSPAFWPCRYRSKKQPTISIVSRVKRLSPSTSSGASLPTIWSSRRKALLNRLSYTGRGPS
ncbi:hypothetical protein LZ31DRAFT_315245 [Colletotrichum somersetense]|nr:hypothetical protein LZ31DRAFT_315245 [Colletotrichum somersetense]